MEKPLGQLFLRVMNIGPICETLEMVRTHLLLSSFIPFTLFFY